MKTTLFAIAAFLSVTSVTQAQTITSTLSVGSRGEQVRILQSFLSLDRNIYPEGLVTGYFGQLTRSAVMRFQRANNIEQVGIVGPLTRTALALKMRVTLPPVAQALPSANTSTVCNASLINSDGLDGNRVISKEACDLLNTLYAQGQAAGNVGDAYENRDGLHVNFCDGWSPNPTCPLKNRLFPQHEWVMSGNAGRATATRGGVTVGQASHAGETSGSIKHSIPYALYKTQGGADILYSQYTHNNLYVYPSLVESTSDNIANTPYVMSSEQIAKAGTDYYHSHDASGSDLTFVKIAFTGLAAFKPEVKRTLVQTSFLMPTLEMLIRHSHRSVNSESDYLSSVAHDNTIHAHYLSNGLPYPIHDSAKLVRITNELTIADVPPLVQLRVVSEDFIDTEKLFSTPGAIARSVGSGTSVRKITVSASDSFDVDGSKMNHTYEWRILKGDTSKVKIIVGGDPSTASIEFMAGNPGQRLDVGVFVKKQNGKYYSTPGIISVYVRP